jgi:hypothetical protein
MLLPLVPPFQQCLESEEVIRGEDGPKCDRRRLRRASLGLCPSLWLPLNRFDIAPYRTIRDAAAYRNPGPGD